jgi:enoyl-CoA hydratase
MLRVKEFLFTGDRIGPEQAVALGLANRVVPAAELMGEALKLAQRLARLPQRALRDTKRALNAHIERAVTGPLEIALQTELASMASPEHAERVRKLVAKSSS